MKKVLLALPIALALTACGSPSVEDFIENPEKLQAALEKCNMLVAQGKDADTEECNNAQTATQKMMNNVINNTMKQMGH
ncbi:EexN family lipoprotein [Zhongshania borealis]|uniref:EexN family lipoprotein n=1 Tax=Zhongshania borealis TaxID=889488 RepID=A0ABP7WT94_9GAMM